MLVSDGAVKPSAADNVPLKAAAASIFCPFIKPDVVMVLIFTKFPEESIL